AASEYAEVSNPFALACRNIEKIGALGFAPHAAGPDEGIGSGRQGQAAVTDAQPQPIENERQIKQYRRNALGERNAPIVRSKRGHAFAYFRNFGDRRLIPSCLG